MTIFLGQQSLKLSKFLLRFWVIPDGNEARCELLSFISSPSTLLGLLSFSLSPSHLCESLSFRKLLLLLFSLSLFYNHFLKCFESVSSSLISRTVPVYFTSRPVKSLHCKKKRKHNLGGKDNDSIVKFTPTGENFGTIFR